MRTGVHDGIHVQVQIIKFLPIGVRLGCINRDLDSINLLFMMLDDGRDYLGVFLVEPPASALVVRPAIAHFEVYLKSDGTPMMMVQNAS